MNFYPKIVCTHERGQKKKNETNTMSYYQEENIS